MKTLGLDIGTTTISAVVLENGAELDSLTLPNGGFLTGCAPWERIQDPLAIRATVMQAVEALFACYPDIRAIGVTAGIVFALISGLTREGEAAVDSPVQMLRTLPALALSPLFIVWFGFGIASKVVLIATFVFFPVMVNMYSGLRSTTDEEEELMRVSHATRWQRLRHLRLYKSLPFLFAAFEASFVLCLTGAVFAELLGSGTSVGLGTMLQMYTARLDVAGMFGIITLLALFGVILDVIVKLAARYFLRWDRPTRS